jgi:hypothetical protein
MHKSLLVGAAALTLLAASPTFAGFATSVSYSGPTGAGQGANLIAAPPTALGAASNAYQVWNETSGTIASPVTLENNGAVGSYAGAPPSSVGTPTTLSTGTPYGSTMVQLDPTTIGVNHSGEAIIMFSSKIIGIALSGATSPTSLGSLGNTDSPYGGSTVYPSAYNPANNRGIIGKTNDSFVITDGGLELEVKLTANNGGFKELRVFTSGSASGVPEPASLAIWSLVGTVFAGRSWWRRQRPAV